MTISIAVEKHGFVEVYDDKNKRLFHERGELYGYTSNSVSVKKQDGFIYTYDEQGHKISHKRA